VPKVSKPAGKPLPAYAPQLATLVEKAPEGDWLHEIKYDGYRMGALVKDGSARLESRSGQDWTAAYPVVVDALAKLPVRTARTTRVSGSSSADTLGVSHELE
jgi:bifunctional non-homologous end joining protein LigD